MPCTEEEGIGIGRVVAKVAVSKAIYAIDKPYDYLVPPELEGQVLPGMRVAVPFGSGNRGSDGIVLSLERQEENTPTLKPVLSCLDDAPVLDEKGIQLALWMRERYFCTVSDAVKAMLPAGMYFALRDSVTLVPGLEPEQIWDLLSDAPAAARLAEMLCCWGGSGDMTQIHTAFGAKDPTPAIRVLLDRKIAVLETSAQRAVGDKTERLAVLNMPAEEAMELVASRRKRAPLRYAVTELLCTLGAASTKELCYFTGASPATLRSLEKSGILNKRKHEVYMLVIDEDEARVVRMMFDLCISSGYGRWRLANFLNDHGIKNRKGQNWHDASVGGILHNPLYKGILRSGETYAGPFEALQIIAPDQFDLAQKLMLERTNERKERRTVPLNTAGQSLLSGNIFCGHCGGRLVLTTNGTTTRLADGTPVHKKRIRYVCYNKTRRRQECTGQTGYTMHILDGIVTEVLHQVFDKMQGASNDMIVGSAVQKQMAMIRSELQRARAENTKANKEYESLKAEVLKAIQGKSALPQDVLTEMLEDTRQKVLSTSERITTLTAELNDGNSKIEEMKAEFNRIVSWSKIFDESPMEVKKMICGYIIKKVSVFRDYRVKIEFNINVEQFLNGIDSIDECDTTYELPMAQ